MTGTTDFYPPTKSEGYSFDVIRLSVSQWCQQHLDRITIDSFYIPLVCGSMKDYTRYCYFQRAQELLRV